METQPYDFVIVGGGAAGLSAALVLGRARRRVAVIDAGSPRNAPAAHIQELTPAEASEFDARGIRVVHGEVARLVVEDDHLTGVELADGQIVLRAAVFVRPITTPHPDNPLDAMGCDLDEAGFAVVHRTGRTSTAGVWGAGNAVTPAPR